MARPAAVIVVVAVAAVGAGAYLWNRTHHTPLSRMQTPATVGGAADTPSRPMVERAADVGITFRTNSIPAEYWHANLYDHGTGVAVGDFDGDGRDDIYLVNQLGQN